MTALHKGIILSVRTSGIVQKASLGWVFVAFWNIYLTLFTLRKNETKRELRDVSRDRDNIRKSQEGREGKRSEVA